MSEVRYAAEWIEDMDDVETDNNAISYHPTYEEAERAAFAGGRRCNVIQWCRVREQRRIDGRWQTVKKWTGDWDYLEEVT